MPMAITIDQQLIHFMPRLGLRAGVGQGADMDAAWDVLQSSCSPSSALALADPAGTRVMSQLPGPAPAVLRKAARHSEQMGAGDILAWPLASRSSYSRRTVRLVVDDTEVEAPGDDVPLLLSEHPFLSLVESMGEAIPGEILEDARVTSRTARYKPVVTRGTGSSTAEWVVLSDKEIVLGGFRTSGEAKKAAISLIRGMNGHDAANLKVVKVSAKETGPVWSIDRDRVRQRIRAQVTWATAKKDPLPCVGWIFCCRDELR